MPEDVVHPNPAEDVEVLFDLERQAIPLGHAKLPDPTRPLHLLEMERRVTGISQELVERVIRPVLQVGGEVLVVAPEPPGRQQSHRRRRANACFISLTLRNGPKVRPARMSASASCSPACHAFVQKYA